MVNLLLRRQSSGRLPQSRSPQVSTKLVFDDVGVSALPTLLSETGTSLADCQLSISHNATHIAVSSGSTLYIIPTDADNSQSYKAYEVDTDNSNHLITSLRWCESLHSTRSLLFVGYSDGHFTVHSSDGQLLTTQHMHTEPVQSFQFILQQKLGHPVVSLLLSYGPSVRTIRVIVYIDGGELMEWKSTGLQQTLQHSPKRRKSQVSADDSNAVWKFEKWRLLDQQTSCIIPITPMQAFDIDALQSTYSTLPAFVGAGAEPMLAYYRASEEEQDSLNAVSVANEIASKVRSQIFSYASSYTKTWWSASAATSPNNAVEELPPSRQPAAELDWLRAVKDELRTVDSMTLDPSSTYAACSDSLGRVMILDTRHLVIRRMFKGYRDAQTCFIRVAAANAKSEEPSPQAGLYLLILAPHRGLLECWRMLTGERVGYAHVPVGCHLHNISATTSQTNATIDDVLPTACVVTNSGAVQRIHLQAYAATISDQSSTQHVASNQSPSLQSLSSKYQQYAEQHLSECNGDSCTLPSASVLQEIGQAVRAIFDVQKLEESASAFDRWFSQTVISTHITHTYNGYHFSTWSLSATGSCKALLTCLLDNAVQSLQPHVHSDSESSSARDDTVEIVHADGSTTTMEIGATSSAARDNASEDKPISTSLHARLSGIQQLQQAHTLLQTGTYPHSFITFLSLFGYMQLSSQSIPQIRVRELVATGDSFQPDLQRTSIQQLAHALFGESQLNEIHLTQGGIEVLRHIRQSELSSSDICLLFCSWWLDLPPKIIQTVTEKPELYRQPIHLYWKAALRITTASDMLRAVRDAVQHTPLLLHASTLITTLQHYISADQSQATAEDTSGLQSDLVHLQQLQSVVAQLQLTGSDTSLSTFTTVTPLSALIARHVLANSSHLYRQHTAHEKQVQTVASGEMVRSSVASKSSDSMPVLSRSSITTIVNELLTQLNETKPDKSTGSAVASQRWKLVADVDSVLYYCAHDMHRSCQAAKNTLASEHIRAASAYAAIIRPSYAAAGLATSMWKTLQPYISALCNAALVEELPKPTKSSSTPALTFGNACKFMKTVLQRDGHTLFDVTTTAHVANIIEAAQSLLGAIAAVSASEALQSSSRCDVLVAAPSLQITADTAGKPPPSDQLQAARERAACTNLLHTHARLSTSDSGEPLSNMSLAMYDQSLLRWSQCDKQQLTYAHHINTVLQVLHVMHESDTDMALQIKQHSRLTDLYAPEVIAAVQDRLPQEADDVTGAQQITVTASQLQARVLFLASVIRQSNAWSSVQHLFQAFQLTPADRTSLLYEHVLVLLEHGQDSAAYDACCNSDDMIVVACAAAHVCRARLGLFVHSLEQRNKTQYNAVIQSVPGNAWSWLAATKPPVLTGNKSADDPTIQLLRTRIITIKQRPEHIDLHAAHILLKRSAQWTQRAISSETQVAPLQDLFQQTGVNTISYRTANPLQYAYYYSYQLNEIVQKIRQSFNAA